MTESLISDEARALIGKASEPAVTIVEASMIRRFVDSIGDDNPLYTDPEKAGSTGHRGIIAPPTFCGSLNKNPLPDVPLSVSRLLNGGDEIENYAPIRPGDVIVAVSKYVDFFERKGSLGQMVFVITEITYTNQHGKLVAKHTMTRIRY